MQSNQPTIISATGAEMPVTNVVFHDNFVIAYTDTISVRFEKVGDKLENGDFKITGDLSVFMPVAAEEVATPAPTPEPTPAPEPTIENETADVVVDPAAGTVTGVDVATEGGDTTVETTAAPVTTE